MKFKKGDYVVRTIDSWFEIKVGDTLIIKDIIDYRTGSQQGLVFDGIKNVFASSYFELSPLNNSPLLKALS